MNLLAQQLAVSALVIVAALSATWRLLSAGTKLRLLSWLARKVPATGFPGALLQRRLRQRQAAMQSGGCENCSANPGASSKKI
jgi:hypothetical protein